MRRRNVMASAICAFFFLFSSALLTLLSASRSTVGGEAFSLISRVRMGRCLHTPRSLVVSRKASA